jgi:HAD superfamily hydrolase (TIGR01459 family)
MRILDGIAPLAERYDGFILDLWGVVHDGQAAYPGVVEALAALRAAGKPVAFLSNAPRRAAIVARQLAGMGIDPPLYAAIVTSGELARHYLLARAHPWFARLGPRAFQIGPERDRGVVEASGIELVAAPADADFVLNTGPEPQHGADSVEPYRDTLAACAGHALPMLCCNPDRAVMIGGSRIIAAGALADAYRAMGGDVFEIGKPDPIVYPPALLALGIDRRERVLAIGDSPTTDLKGAAAAGIDAVWALTGLAADQFGEAVTADALAAEAARQGVAPIAALRGLRW